MENPMLDVVMRRSYPELARAMRARLGRVMDRWQDAVRETLPHADALTLKQLQNDLPKVLAQMADALESERPALTQDIVDKAPEHGEVRFHQSFNLAELMIEYHVLRSILVEEVMRELGRRLEVDDAIALNLLVDVVLRQSVVAFNDHQTRQLRHATEAQSKYLSFLSHDLRGGLNGVSLMIEVLKRELVKEARFAESVEDLEVMRRSIFETIGTMDRFLHAERFRKGKVQVKPGPVNLNAVANEMAAQFVYQAKDKGVELRTEGNPSGPAGVTSDRELLTLILQNLISNAIKYSREGTILVSVRREAADGPWRVSVSDQGPGIPAERLKDLFTPFTRGETHGQGGVGLGLSIAQQAAEMLGARLWAESEVGRGSAFHLEVPAGP